MAGPFYSYADGTISIEQGSTTFEGTATTWLTNLKRADVIYVRVSTGSSPDLFEWKIVGFVDEVTDNLTGELLDAYEGETIANADYRIVRGAAWYAGAAVNETMIQFLTELGILGLAGASSTSGAPAADYGRENQIHVDGNRTVRMKIGGVWYDLNSPSHFHARGSLTSPAQRDQYDDGQGNLDDYVGPGLLFFDTNTGQYYVLITAATASPDSSAVWAGPFEWRGPTGPAGETGGTGPAGTAATIAVGIVTTVEPAGPATVTNVGSSSAATFDFEIPKGDPGVGIILTALSPEDYAALNVSPATVEEGMLYLTITGLADPLTGVNLVKVADESAYDALTPNANTVYIW